MQEETCPSYDWFVATVFLMNHGDVNSSLRFVYNFSQRPSSPFIWWSRLYSVDDVLPVVYSTNGININLSTTCHYIELILKLELPLIFSAFRMSGLAPSQICLHWIKQCFWNYLDWKDIVAYLAICLVFGIDYQTYFCIAILKHLNEKNLVRNMNQRIMQYHTNRNLLIFLRESQIVDFKIENSIEFMRDLEKKYRKYILTDIKDYFN